MSAHEPEAVGFGGRLLRTVAGILAAGALALALVVGAFDLLSDVFAIHGPGTDFTIGHGVGAVVAVVAAVVADRTRGSVGAAAAAATIVVVGALVWFYWLA